ncbi:MAG: caspase family protein [Acidobacteriota bacterium]
MRRALLVGIDDYTSQKNGQEPKQAAPPNGLPRRRTHWSNLSGAVHDADEMRRLLICCFHFKESGIRLLLNSQATRQGILDAIREHLIEPTRPGDEAVFFYAGHGSQVINPLSDELDKKDESLVPSDSIAAAPDIRDKELRRHFNRVIDQGGRVTVILDCCHSGSALRGLPQGRLRQLPPTWQQVEDAPDPAPPPEQRGALVLSAAQDHQPANEDWDDVSNRSRGAFSMALIHVLQRTGSWESAEQVFLRARAFLQARKAGQEPVLAGRAKRRQEPVFAPRAAAMPQGVQVAVQKVESDGTLLLQAGWGAGLSPGSELVRVNTNSAPSPLRVRVLPSPDLASCKAETLSGNGVDAEVGDLLELVRWAAPLQASLKVWVPQVGLDAPALFRLAGRVRECVTDLGLSWMDDPVQSEEGSTGFVLSWEGGWVARDWNGKTLELGQSLSVQRLRQHLSDQLALKGPHSGFFFHLPAPSGLDLALGSCTPHTMVEECNREQADYFLSGRLHQDSLDYAWVRPNATGQDTHCALPPRTDWYPCPTQALHKPASSGPILRDGGRSDWGATRSSPLRDGGRSLAPRTLGSLSRQLLDSALKIAKIRSWLTLVSPDPGLFPYRLALHDTDSGRLVEEGKLPQGTRLGLVLRALPQGLGGLVRPRFVYVFSIDSFGKATLLFPPLDAGCVENRFPIQRGGAPYPEEIPLGSQPLFASGPPFGLDTYILLSSREAIPNPGVVEAEGVRTRGQASQGLQELLSCWGTVLRGTRLLTTPASWSIQRLTFESIPV